MKKEKTIQNRISVKIIVGLVAGLISGLFSAGGGMILVPAFIHIFNMEDNKARATSVFVILPLVITSGIFFYKSNYIDWGIGIKCAIGGIFRRNNWSKIIKKIFFKNIKNFIYYFFNICGNKNDLFLN